MASEHDDLKFSVIPEFARFIVDNHLDDFIIEEITASRQFNMPLWEQFRNTPDQVLLANSRPYYSEFLEALAADESSKNLFQLVCQYKEDLLSHVYREQITGKDLLLTMGARRKAFMRFLPRYTSDPDLIFKLIAELDTLILRYNIDTAEAYISLLKSEVNQEQSLKQKLFSTSPGFYYLYDIENDVQVIASEKLFKSLGYIPAEYKGKNRFFRDLMHPDDLENAQSYLDSLVTMQDDEVRFFEYRLRDASGQYRWMKNYESVYRRSDSGAPTQLLGVAFDITWERSFAEEIKSKDEALSEAQSLANIGAFTWDIQKNKLIGFTPHLASLGLQEGHSFVEMMGNVHPSDKSLVLGMYEKAIKGRRDYEVEYRCMVNNREHIFWSKGKVTELEGKPAFLKATVMDVTDKHHMVRKLQRSEELYKQAQALNRIGNWSWTFNSERVQWSDELFRIYGLAPQSERMTFERYLSFVHPDDRPYRLEAIEEQSRNPGHREYYFRIITADGRQKIIYGQSEVLLNDEGAPYKMIGTCQDVTEQKTLEKALFDRTIQLQKSNASLQVFAYISSHDLKEPLRKISLFGDRLRMLNKGKLDEQSLGVLNTIIQSSLRLQQMIDEILSVSRINADENFEHVSLQDILEEVLISLQVLLSEKNGRVTHDPLPMATVNPLQMQQLFLHLISNSLKFSRPGVPPEIYISVDTPTVKEISDAGLENSGIYTRLRFKDNGIGFNNDYAEKIFTIFQRLHDKAAYKGTGIGLAICREIMNHHHGVIKARGILQEGAVFEIILPLQRN